MLAKFNNSGGLVWATYYGGNSGDNISDVAADAFGNIYIVGTTSSTNAMYSTGAFQATPTEGFIAKFSSGGARQWGSYISARLQAVACSPSGYVYITGWTDSAHGIATAGAYQTSLSSTGTYVDGMLMKFNANGQQIWGTYYNGNVATAFYDVAVDNSENVYIGGSTRCTSGVTSTGAYQTTLSGGADGLLVKFNANGQRQWATLYGGPAIWISGLHVSDEIRGMTTFPNGDVYITGVTESTSGIATGNAYQASLSGSGTSDGFLAQFTKNGQLKYATYYGGPSGDGLTSVAYSNRKLYSGGGTSSTSGIATPLAYQTSLTGSQDAFVVQFAHTDTNVFFKAPFTDTAICAGDTLHVKYDVTYNFHTGNTFGIQLSDASGSFASPTTLATVSGTGPDSIKWKVPAIITSGTAYAVRIIATSPADTVCFTNIKLSQYPTLTVISNSPTCAGDSIKLHGTGSPSTSLFTWTGPLSVTLPAKDTFIANVGAANAGYYVLTVNNNNCKVKDSVNVTVNPLPAKPTAGSNSPVCPGTTLNLTGSSTTTGGVSYSWTGPNGFTATTQNPSKTSVVFADSGKYVLTVDLNGCTAKDTTHVVTQILTPTPSAGSNSPICAGATLNLTASPVSGASYSWTGPGGFTANTQNANRAFAATAHAGIYSVTANVAGCVSLPGTVNVTINQGPLVNIFPHPSINICSGDSLTLVAIPTNGGSNPTFQWYRNNVLQTGQTSVYYTTLTATNKDSFYVMMTVPASVCNSSIGSNTLKATVTPATPAPVSTIVDNPSTNIWPGLNVQFSISSMTNQGSSPAYQWMRNSKPVIGAINNTWGATTLNDKDTVCLLLTSSNVCARPKSALSNCIVMNIATGIEKLGSDVLNIYPNPNRGNFTIESKEAGTLYLYSITGQIVASYTVGTGKNNISLDGSLSAGNYTGRFVNLPPAPSPGGGANATSKTYDLKITLE